MTSLDWAGRRLYSQANGKRIACRVGEFIQKGGEGSVYRDLERRHLALKILHEPSDRMRRKLHRMLTAAPELQTQLEPDGTETVQIAWPQESLCDSQDRFCGFSMRYLDFSKTVSLNAWFDCRSRSRNALSQDDRVRIYLAANLASVTEYIHKAGHAVIDFKPQNVRAYREHGYVCLVDCDGFFVRSGNDMYPAAVATPAFLAPEHHRNFDPSKLDEKHDRFALAVLLYMLLDNGYSPTSGSSDRLPHDIKGRLAAGAVFLDPHSGLTPPEWSHYRYLHDETLTMFRRAFTTANRPTSGEWKAHLRDLTTVMVQCKVRAEHWHYGKGCPWCEIARSPRRMVQIRVPSVATIQPSPAASPRQPAPQKQINPNVQPPNSFIAGLVMTLLMLFVVVLGISAFIQVSRERASVPPSAKQGSSAALGSVQQATGSLRITNVSGCIGKYSTVSNAPRCSPDETSRNVGVRFDFSEATPHQTVVVVKWSRNGVALGKSDRITLVGATGWAWANYTSSTSDPLPSGRYEAVFSVLDAERGRGHIIVAAQKPVKSASATVLRPGNETGGRSPQVVAAERLRRARALLEAREYGKALAEAEQAIQSEPGNQEARILRDQIQRVIQILDPSGGDIR